MYKQNWRVARLALAVVLFTQMALAADKLPNIKILATGGTIAVRLRLTPKPSVTSPRCFPWIP